MTTERSPLLPRRDDVRSPRSGARAVSGTESEKPYYRNIIMLCSLLAAASVLATATISCTPIPCPSGYADPNWCQHRGGGGGGESGGGH